MIDKDVVYAKINNIQNCLKRIYDTTKVDTSGLLEDLNVQDIVVLNLQRAIQAVIDLAAHVVASARLGIPDSQKSLFTLLQKEGILSQSLTQAMQKMVGFRNIAVHEYSKIDPHILEKIITEHLSELEAFYSAVLEYYDVDSLK